MRTPTLVLLALSLCACTGVLTTNPDAALLDGSIARDSTLSSADVEDASRDVATPPDSAMPDSFVVPLDDTWTRRGGSLSVDAQGWASNSALAVEEDGTLYAAWTQHLNPAVWEHSGVYVRMQTDEGWTTLGGRIGHTEDADIVWPEAFDPSLTLVAGTPYVAWYEGGGYGWTRSRGSTVFVSHWDGTEWVSDGEASDEHGALNVNPSAGARNPFLANVDGALHAAWVEHTPESRNRDTVFVKRLIDGRWSRVGSSLSAYADSTQKHKIIDVAMVGSAGVPYVAWSEYLMGTATEGGPSVVASTVHVARWNGDDFDMLGGALGSTSLGYANYLAITELDDTVYVAWQEKSNEGNYNIFVKHWDGTGWVADGESLNVNPERGEAGRPALSAGAGRIWLAWTEGGPAEKSQLYVRSLDGAEWSEPTASLNMSAADGSADAPSLAISGGTPHVSWTERHFPSATKQIYVSGRDREGDHPDVELVQYGADGPPVNPAPNTWVEVNPGGIVEGASGVGDEGYDSFQYVAATQRSVVFGKYHAVEVSYGEDQNALLAYDSQRNRWDIVEITENSWSEHLPGIGHDAGEVTIDPVQGLYISHGNLTLNGGTRGQTYIYDFQAGRGKRMLPRREGGIRLESTGAFDPVRRIAYIGAHFYDVAQNTWAPVEGCPLPGAWAGSAFDVESDRFVQFGGNRYQGPDLQDTFLIDPATRSCQVVSPRVSLPGGRSLLTYNSLHGVVMALVASSSELWAYDVAANTWSAVGPAPTTLTVIQGQNLTYDEGSDLLLLHDGTNLTRLQAFRYIP